MNRQTAEQLMEFLPQFNKITTNGALRSLSFKSNWWGGGCAPPARGQDGCVFKIHMEDQSGALKAFYTSRSETMDHYQELGAVPMLKAANCLPNFEWVTLSSDTAGRKFDGLLMSWLDGPTLHNWLLEKYKANDTDAVGQMTRQIDDLASTLAKHGIIHGNISLDNIIVTPDALMLVDLDTLKVPTQTEQPQVPPDRLSGSDNMNFWLIQWTLRLLKESPNLIERIDECLCLRADHLVDPSTSQFLQWLKHSPSAGHAAFANEIFNLSRVSVTANQPVANSDSTPPRQTAINAALKASSNRAEGHTDKQGAQPSTGHFQSQLPEFTKYKRLWSCRFILAILLIVSAFILLRAPLIPYRFLFAAVVPFATLAGIRFAVSIFFFLESGWTDVEKWLLLEHDRRTQLLNQLKMADGRIAKLKALHEKDLTAITQTRDDAVHVFERELQQLELKRTSLQHEKAELRKQIDLVRESLSKQKNADLFQSSGGVSPANVSTTTAQQQKELLLTDVYGRAIAILNELHNQRSKSIDTQMSGLDSEERKKLSSLQIRIENLSMEYLKKKQQYNQACTEIIDCINDSQDYLVSIRKCLKSFEQMSVESYFATVMKGHSDNRGHANSKAH